MLALNHDHGAKKSMGGGLDPATSETAWRVFYENIRKRTISSRPALEPGGGGMSMMELTPFFGLIATIGAAVFVAGFFSGSWGEARQWRAKGNHEYMNTKESGGSLYTVRRIRGSDDE